MKSLYHFVDGLAYCEAKHVYSEAYEKKGKNSVLLNQSKKPLISKSGHYMILVRWKVVDSVGNVGFIDDYISEKAEFKIKNLENALNVSNLFDPISKNFNTYFLKGRVCGCCLKRDQLNPQYGSKILSYVPLEFYSASVNKAILESNEQESQKIAVNI